jgi:hypothetical protein
MDLRSGFQKEVSDDAEMTVSKFRLLVWLHLAFTIVGIGAAFLPNNFSPELTTAYENQPVPWLVKDVWALFAIAALVIPPWIAGFFGLLLLRRWGRVLALYSTALTLLAYPVFGPHLMSGLESALFEAAALCWGAVLALAYYSEIRVKFDESGPAKQTSATRVAPTKSG